MNITVPPSAWQPVGGDDGQSPGRLLATVTINGCPMHLEAWQVRVRGSMMEPAPDSVDEETFNSLYYAVGADGHMQTVRIKRRRYVLVASPFCE